MIEQIEFRLPAKRRGCHLITGEITRRLPSPLPKAGLLNVFVKHTSCGLTINENADPDVRTDMDKILDRLVPENQPYMDMVASEIELKMIGMRDDAQAAHLMRFFKCGNGEYGEGDQFLGLRVPQTRAIVKEFRNRVLINDCVELVTSPWHEVRLAGFLLMTELYKKLKKLSEAEARDVVDCYLSSIDSANNWDLVDLSVNYPLGDWLVDHPGERIILDRLSDMDGKLWHQRVAMVANWMLIRKGEFDDTFRIAEKYLTHPHDLIHKATGWMLREVGKRGGLEELCWFLDRHASKMPRTMLRYAIEKFPEDLRQSYLKK